MNLSEPAYWNSDVDDLLTQLGTGREGLTEAEGRLRLLRYGANHLRRGGRTGTFALLLAQFKTPIVMTLLFAAVLSFFLHDPVDANIILAIILVSGLLGFWQERGAADAIEKLLAVAGIKTTVLRGGSPRQIPLESVVPGDIILLDAGDAIPADCRILEAKDLYADEATLTGETFPVEKESRSLPREAPLHARANILFMGTHVVSGTARAVAVLTGKETEFGRISDHLKLRRAETEFERGIRRFGFFLIEVTLALVAIIFAINVYFHRPVLEAFLFSLALAVGLTPQLLPAIISINLAHGAKGMARHKVIVKRLAAIENFGSMDVLCADKTGTLTEGAVRLKSALGPAGEPSERVFLHAYLNAAFETGFANPMDEAIRSYAKPDISAYKKMDEVPYDFIRKRLSILVETRGRTLMVTKGTLTGILAICSRVETTGGETVATGEAREEILRRFEALSIEGYRLLGVACRDMEGQTSIGKSDEQGMTFLGYLVFFDPPKQGITEAIAGLGHLGVSLKMITGDNRLVAAKVGRDIGLETAVLITGSELRLISDDALHQKAADTDIFAEIEPNQKERIILALRKAGHVVGYLGDGINDAPALHAADVGISVDTAVDVARESADIVLLEKDLAVLIEGIREGRITFANTLKYVFMATSANFGNMFSMAGASLFLPFLPLLPKQILLTNLLTDFPEMTIATDRIDPEMVEKPRRWNIAFIRRFMMTFGLVSSVFDYLTFGVLLFILRATPDQFRTGWFVESVVSAAIIVLVIRTRRPFFKSRPGRALTIATTAIVLAAIAIPFTAIGRLFGFGPLPFSFLALMGLIVGLYVGAAEWAKVYFYRNAGL